jgi:uracil-DNA glycosylase family 4
MEDCHKCRLRESCNHPVGGSGAGKIMFIGEAPGETEDKLSIPFIGKSGALLRNAVGDDNYFTNAVKCRPPNNRKPSDDEIEACFPFLKDEIDKIKPKVIVFIGKTSYSLYDRLSKLYPEIQYEFFYHPSYALRTGTAKDWSKEISSRIRKLKQTL